MARECSLCGGKLRGNICTECGLDNSKCDASYKTSQSHGWGTELTHSHNKVDPLAGKTMTSKQQEELKAAIKARKGTGKQSLSGSTMSYQYDQNEARQMRESVSRSSGGVVEKGKKAGSCLIALIITISVLMGAISVIVSEVRDVFQWEEGVYEPDYFDTNYDPYASAYELEQTGEYYRTTLSSGTYIGGVHIPVGIYEVTLLGGAGELYMYHPGLDICVNATAYNAEEGAVLDPDFRVYEGARIELKDGIDLAFVTENAVLPTTSLEENPNKDSVILEDGFTVGEDVEQGIYDVYCLEGSGIFDYTVENADGYSSYEGKLLEADGSDFPALYRNVVLPSGVTVEIEDMKVKLVPSEMIWPVDYETFYEN